MYVSVFFFEGDLFSFVFVVWDFEGVFFGFQGAFFQMGEKFIPLLDV